MSEVNQHNNENKSNEYDEVKLNEKITSLSFEINNLKFQLENKTIENDKFHENFKLKSETFKNNFINFIENKNEIFNSTNLNVKDFFDDDNFPTKNFFEIIKEKYSEHLGLNIKDREKIINELKEKNLKLTEDSNNLINLNEEISKENALIKNKIEEQLKHYGVKITEKNSVFQNIELIENNNHSLNKHLEELKIVLEERNNKIKNLELEIQEKINNKQCEELENLNSRLEESYKKLELQKKEYVDLENKYNDVLKDNNTIKTENLNINQKINDLSSQLDDSNKLIFDNTKLIKEHENITDSLNKKLENNQIVIDDLRNNNTNLEEKLKLSIKSNENHNKENLETNNIKKLHLESDDENYKLENNKLIKDIEELKNKIVELNKENENFKLENSKLVKEITEFSSNKKNIDEYINESNELKLQINDLKNSIENKKQEYEKLEISLNEKDNLIKNLNDQGIKKDQPTIIKEDNLQNNYETENKKLNSEIEKLKEDNLNLNLTIQEKIEIIINLENKVKETEISCENKIYIKEEESHKKLLEMDLQIQDLKDKIFNSEQNSREDENFKLLNSKYVDLKEKCSDFVGILQSELRDFEFYVDKRLVVNFLLKYFDKSSNEKLKYSLLETLANILDLDTDDRKKLNLSSINNNQYSLNSKDNFPTEIETIPFIISKFNEYIENLHFE